MRHCEYIRNQKDSKTAVLLIHGIVGTPDHFRDFIELIPKKWSVHNILLDGHGKGVKEFAASSMEKWKEQVDEHLQMLFAENERVIIVAHSMGTLFAIQAAVKYPQKIKKLFLLAVPLRVHMRLRVLLANMKVALNMGGNDATVNAMMRDCSVKTVGSRPWDYIGWAPRFTELLKEAKTVRKMIHLLQVPTFSYQSENDDLVSLKSCKYLDSNPNITNTVLCESGHFGYTEKENLVVLEDFQKLMDDEEKQA
ncbi:MAG: alpha/beta fold hydrolase [Clostridia bacterium]|nr:alpha/beta fold hydrolase [Clostridia bacterium]